MPFAVLQGRAALGPSGEGSYIDNAYSIHRCAFPMTTLPYASMIDQV